MAVAATILEQLGGNKFTAMTGCTMYLDDGDGLRMKLAKNQSGANKLLIKLNEMDTYDLNFLKITSPGFRRGSWCDGGVKVMATVEGVYADQLQAVFTEITGLETHL